MVSYSLHNQLERTFAGDHTPLAHENAKLDLPRRKNQCEPQTPEPTQILEREGNYKGKRKTNEQTKAIKEREGKYHSKSRPVMVV